MVRGGAEMLVLPRTLPTKLDAALRGCMQRAVRAHTHERTLTVLLVSIFSLSRGNRDHRRDERYDTSFETTNQIIRSFQTPQNLYPRGQGYIKTLP